MKITFVLNGTDLSGGVKAIFEFSNCLIEKGHEVVIVYPTIRIFPNTGWWNFRNLIGKAYATFLNIKSGGKIDWFHAKAKLIGIPIISDRFVPDADIVVATWWETSYEVAKLNNRKGKKYYLIQHFENWGGPEDKIKQSYKLGLKNIVNSGWLKNLIRDSGAPVESLILHAPDHNHFYYEKGMRKKGVVRVLMNFRRDKWKGIGGGLIAYEKATKGLSNVQLIMFGPDKPDKMPPGAEFHFRPSNDELRRLYNSCDIFLFSSVFEGFGMPPMEAMACKCAVVANRVGAIPEYSSHRKNAMLSNPNDIDEMAKNLRKLITDRKLRERISASGYHEIQKHTWKKASDKLEALFKRNP